MWSPVLFVLLVASVRVDADADADADAEPFISHVYPQYNYGNSWAATHFGTPQETLELKGIRQDENAAYHPSLDFLPAMVAPSPFTAIRDVQVAPQSILQNKRPAETHNVQLLQHPAFFFRPPLFFQTSHVRVPDHNQKDPIPVPVATAPGLTFASQHTAQIPIFPRPPTIPNLFQTVPVHIPAGAFPITIQHSQQVPVVSTAQKIDEEDEEDDDDDDNDDDDVRRVNFILVPHFPTELASLTNLRGMEDEPVIPAGIVQSTQPIFKPMVFTNSKAHPWLLGKLQDIRGSSVRGV